MKGEVAVIPSERERKLESYSNAYTELVAALEQFPPAMWHFKAPHDPWSIHEIVVHITDSEVNSYIRCRRAIAEPGAPVMSYDENHWASALRYADQDAQDALELFRWLRKRSYDLVRALPEFVWAQTIEHPENGTMTLDDWLDVYTRHVPEHVAQMQGIHAAWQAKR